MCFLSSIFECCVQWHNYLTILSEGYGKIFELVLMMLTYLELGAFWAGGPADIPLVVFGFILALWKAVELDFFPDADMY